MNYSCPSISAGGWPGIRFSSIPESPLWSRMETRLMRWPTFSPSSWPVWRARALPSLLNCSRATLCHPPRDSATMGMNFIPCSLHSSSVFLHLLLKANVIACPGVVAAPALVASWRGCVMVTSRAASSPPAQWGRKTSAGRRLLPLSFEMKKKVFQTLSRGDKSRYCVSMNKSYMLQILKKMTWLIPTILFTINMQSLTIHLWQTNTFILPNPLHNILKISSGHGISNNVVQKFGQRCNKVANHIFQTQCIAEG